MKYFDYNGVTVAHEQGCIFVLRVNRTCLEVKPVEGNNKQRWVRQEVWAQDFKDLTAALIEAAKITGLVAQESK